MKNDIREEIAKKIRKVVIDAFKGDVDWHDVANEIISLIQKEIESAIPKEKDSGSYDNDYAIGQADGFNICLSDIHKALKEKGLL